MAFSDRGSLLQAPPNLYKVLLAFSQPPVAYVVASYPWLKALVEKDFSLLAVPSTCLPSLLVPFIPYCNCQSSVNYLAKHHSSKYSTGILLVENG
ncbi:hypothetical protein VIGAN_03035700 [Vigna angularis var. angularis]|uniref:Uncharacterized protein n=1 Tax=Vigna angularis var. angularis TaxID=157739 RepID=A0A0S3RJS2_PHAAN|nr:hypothetical protein VIGAN_03035700 [Vigna angularis var. angularis]